MSQRGSYQRGRRKRQERHSEVDTDGGSHEDGRTPLRRKKVSTEFEYSDRESYSSGGRGRGARKRGTSHGHRSRGGRQSYHYVSRYDTDREDFLGSRNQSRSRHRNSFDDGWHDWRAYQSDRQLTENDEERKYNSDIHQHEDQQSDYRSVSPECTYRESGKCGITQYNEEPRSNSSQYQYEVREYDEEWNYHREYEESEKPIYDSARRRYNEYERATYNNSDVREFEDRESYRNARYKQATRDIDQRSESGLVLYEAGEAVLRKRMVEDREDIIQYMKKKVQKWGELTDRTSRKMQNKFHLSKREVFQIYDFVYDEEQHSYSYSPSANSIPKREKPRSKSNGSSATRREHTLPRNASYNSEESESVLRSRTVKEKGEIIQYMKNKVNRFKVTECSWKKWLF